MITRTTWNRALIALVASASVGVACSSKTETRGVDAGNHDAATADDAGDAGEDAGEELADAGRDGGSDGAMPHGAVDSGASPGCTSSQGCGPGMICCASVGGLIKQSACTTAKICEDGAETCEMGGTPCKSGTCQKYLCSVGTLGIKSAVYACAPPVIAGGMCSVALDLDGGGLVDGGQLPNGP